MMMSTASFKQAAFGADTDPASSDPVAMQIANKLGDPSMTVGTVKKISMYVAGNAIGGFLLGGFVGALAQHLYTKHKASR
jgi:hypothetical protein